MFNAECAVAALSRSTLGIMKPILAVAIPAHNEERYIGRCIESIATSARLAAQPIEVVVALNRCTDRTQAIAESLGARCVVNDTKCIAAVRNAAVRATSAPAVATLDADSWMSAHTVSAIIKYVHDARNIGGGTVMWPERVSIGIFFSLLAVAPYVIKRGVSTGMFWFMRESFDAVGGFDESLVSVEDVDFGIRLKAYGQAQGKRYGTIRRNGATTSCRKFDKFGDWYLFRNPRLVREIFEGTNRRAADHFYYDVER
jgi:glycosyltransferase involved in cell wall biosynthesis